MPPEARICGESGSSLPATFTLFTPSKKWRQDRAVERYGVGTVVVVGALPSVSVKHVGASGQRQVIELRVCDVRVEIAIVDEPMLVLRIDRAAQIGMQEARNIDDIRVRIGKKRVPGAKTTGCVQPISP